MINEFENLKKKWMYLIYLRSLCSLSDLMGGRIQIQIQCFYEQEKISSSLIKLAINRNTNCSDAPHAFNYFKGRHYC